MPIDLKVNMRRQHLDFNMENKNTSSNSSKIVIYAAIIKISQKQKSFPHTGSSAFFNEANINLKVLHADCLFNCNNS